MSAMQSEVGDGTQCLLDTYSQRPRDGVRWLGTAPGLRSECQGGRSELGVGETEQRAARTRGRRRGLVVGKDTRAWKVKAAGLIS